MFKKQMITAACALLLAMTPLASSAEMSHDDKNALIAGLALGILGAAVATNQHHNGEPDYTPHPHVSPDENKVGMCMHRAHRALTNRGHHQAKFDHVVNHHGNHLTIRVTSDGKNNHQRHYQLNATCTFDDGKISNFNMQRV